MIVLPIGVIWFGYQLVWYGYSLLRGPGMGFTDLMLPQRTGKASQVIASWSTASSSSGGAARGGPNPAGSTTVPQGPQTPSTYPAYNKP